MQRYFFHIHHHDDRPDYEGTELPNPDEARNQAVVACGEMLKDLDGKFWDGHEWRMEVKDWRGATVCVLNVSGNRY